MNVMRKLPWALLLIVAAVLALAAAGCGGDDDSGTDTSGTPAESGTTEGGGGGEKISVGLVTDIGGLNDRGFNELANNGLETAKTELGVDGRVLESKSDADYIPNLSTLAEEGSDLVISNGFLMGAQTHQAAAEFPDTNFAIIDFGYGGEDCEASDSCELPNLQGLVFREDQAGYLVGYLAGLTTETNTVSAVGGQAVPAVVKFLAGFQQGAQDANPDVKVLYGYSQEFVDPSPCKELALEQIANGSDVVFAAAGGCGLGALDAAKEKSIWGIGVDKDQAFLGDHILTSAVKRVDVAVTKTIEAAQSGSFEGGGVTVFDLAGDGVGLGEVSSKVPQEDLDKIEEVKQQVIDEEIEIQQEPTKG